LNSSKHKNIRIGSQNYVGGGWYFVTICYADSRRIFSSPSRCESFLEHLRQAAASRSFVIHAYCIMPDHVHLLAEGLDETADLLNFMKTLKVRTSREFRHARRRRAVAEEVFDHILRPGEVPDRVAWYIWMNPVRAALAGSVGEYRLPVPFPGMVPSAHVIGKDWLPPYRFKSRPPQKAAATSLL